MKEKLYYPELDGLRFLAFLAVFMHHGPMLPGIPGYHYFIEFGWIGVDLFLCLSAFLFVHLLRKEWEMTGTINVWFFYLRRSLRIWPIYVIFVTIIVLITIGLNVFTDQSLLRVYGLLTFTDNLLAAGLGYNSLRWVGHLWTISYEEQFYAGVPWFLRFIFKQTRQMQLLTLFMLFIIGLSIRAIFIVQKFPNPAIWVLPVTHFKSILFGLAIGLGMFDIVFKRVPAWMTTIAGVGGLYFCANLPNVYIIDWSLMLLYPMVGISVALLVHSTLKAGHGKATAWLRWQPIPFLGKISYGLYLFHLVGLNFPSTWAPGLLGGMSQAIQNYLIFGLGLGLTIGIAALSYIFIEKPFLKIKSRFTIVESRPA